jgi:hypothetical protein
MTRYSCSANGSPDGPRLQDVQRPQPVPTVGDVDRRRAAASRRGLLTICSRARADTASADRRPAAETFNQHVATILDVMNAASRPGSHPRPEICGGRQRQWREVVRACDAAHVRRTLRRPWAHLTNPWHSCRSTTLSGVAGISELAGRTTCEFTGPVSWRACWGSRGFSFRSGTFRSRLATLQWRSRAPSPCAAEAGRRGSQEGGCGSGQGGTHRPCPHTTRRPGRPWRAPESRSNGRPSQCPRTEVALAERSAVSVTCCQISLRKRVIPIEGAMENSHDGAGPPARADGTVGWERVASNLTRPAPALSLGCSHWSRS